MSYSRRQLYAMGEPLGDSATRKEGGRIIYGGGGGGPTSSTTNTSNIPDWLRPQVETVLAGSMEELFKTDFAKDPETGKQILNEAGQPVKNVVEVKKDAFKPYSANPQDYVAGFSPLQQQVQYNAANLQMPGQYNQATGLTGLSGMGALGTAQQAQNMGGDYMRATSNVYNPKTGGYDASNAVGSFMSPYMQNVVDIQNQAAQRQADIAKTQRQSQATRAGAFGGSRQAIENAEANRSLQSMMNNNQLQGQQAAYQGALQNMQYGAGLGMQGIGAAQQGYGMAGQAGAGLANIGNQQLAAQQGILGLQQQVGGQQQAQEQQIINQGIQNYANQQQAPMQAYNQYNALLRGYAVPGMTTTQYQAAPSMTSQIAGLGTAAAGAYGLMKKKGGAIKEPKGRGIDSLGLRNALTAGK
jgi:hypothetical protein